MRTERTIRPNPSFKPLAGFFFVVKNGVAQMARHGALQLMEQMEQT
jgi:hypothetical protein